MIKLAILTRFKKKKEKKIRLLVIRKLSDPSFNNPVIRLLVHAV